MNKLIKIFGVLVIILLSFNFYRINDLPVITYLTYDDITQTGVTIYWTTDSPSDSKIKWMVSDSNYQQVVFTDSVYNSTAVTNHAVTISNLQPSKIYKYNVYSQNAGGTGIDSGYFITKSTSTGRVDVYFNHSVDTTVSTGEKAHGNYNFENIYLNLIDSAQYSIDITLFSFSDYNSISTALVNAKRRGVKIRFIYDSTPNTPLIDTMLANGIPVLKRNYDTSNTMHNKFFIFDYRNNSNSSKKFLLTGSTNVTHPQFHSDKNNVIVIQDESLCAVYTREFEEMWGTHTDIPNASKAKFGPIKINNTPHILNIAGTRMEVYFSPSDSIPNYLNKIITTKTTKSIFFCILRYSLSSIENSMHTVFNAGKQIKGVFDLSKLTDSNCTYPRMRGLPVQGTWNPPASVFVDSSLGLLHHKYFIVDANSTSGNKITATGSYNWDLQATYHNDENSLIIYNNRVNNLYYQEFYSRYRGAGGELLSINNTGFERPYEYRIEQNYPNPFNSRTVIRFQLLVANNVSIKVYDIQGREVRSLVSKKMNPGSYKVVFDGTEYSNGVYFYQMRAGSFYETRRMILIK